MALRDIRGKIYDVAVKDVMFRVAPERIHGAMSVALKTFAALPAAHKLLDRAMVVHDPVLSQTVAGIDFPRPLGLAAGFDKNAEEVDAWGPIGFGFAEVGTVTSVEQPGNPTPRLFRLPEDRALLNRMGFNNDGAEAAARRLARRSTNIPIGVNMGKTKRCEPEQAPGDYRASTAFVADVADYLVINVSSPNTPGLRDLQAVESLKPIIAAVQETSDKPLFVKIAPDLSNEDIDAVTDLALETGIAGLIATNTTISREGLATDGTYVRSLGAGGVSGAPVAARAQEVLERIYARAGSRLILIGVGGIETPRQAWERIAAGATLLQGYTPFIYGGPDWIRDIHLGLAQQVRAHGFSNISEAVGCGLPWREV
ncbi:quinone-dependent dihydroorotate dehydrogenase [Corynebacterium sp. 320]|uniref:quinone-dependent dihydroorotate dehydrogenase n=1 Tax=Corynebacterium TaxID=1716 RepID=UPI00125CD141|nr:MULTISPECIES: quinone-dependent dihydroorotate dehydrogenase [Corynebacterium]KAB1503646.1 quinone-dependent dihydroorotate dehydrogenase [Corynebacterium sp. 320]KAB1553253.1 quinone-dependent dihydroorotate dehydrogenase [Corynebacterium sp. 321]KAB1553528.1 quinone-dependent dihydroorotate dehydrogenase [Corynebacterium sp. 319]KAB3527782.1 quinone-dependent dihydroorotate dehydrogenase [Corynebacterium sp. 250]KAB3540729.1 quinone-dependent dihydroorotate dehydrogenase [Corynebacterium 